MELAEYDIECLVKAKAMIDADLSRHHTIAYIALKTAIGSTRLKQGFKQYFGQPVFTYLHERRMKESREMIENTSVPVKQLAKRFGYKYYRNFVLAFTIFHGVTPKQLRRKHS